MVRVFVFPGPRPFAWLPVLALAPGPKFVFTGPGPKFVFTGPGSDFVFAAPGRQIVFAPIYLPALAPNLRLPTLT